MAWSICVRLMVMVWPDWQSLNESTPKGRVGKCPPRQMGVQLPCFDGVQTIVNGYLGSLQLYYNNNYYFYCLFLFILNSSMLLVVLCKSTRFPSTIVDALWNYYIISTIVYLSYKCYCISMMMVYLSYKYYCISMMIGNKEGIH